MGKLDAASLRKYLNIALNEKDFFEDNLQKPFATPRIPLNFADEKRTKRIV